VGRVREGIESRDDVGVDVSFDESRRKSLESSVACCFAGCQSSVEPFLFFSVIRTVKAGVLLLCRSLGYRGGDWEGQKAPKV